MTYGLAVTIMFASIIVLSGVIWYIWCWIQLLFNYGHFLMCRGDHLTVFLIANFVSFIFGGAYIITLIAQ